MKNNLICLDLDLIKKLDLSLEELAILYIISKYDVCNLSKLELANIIAISERKVYRIINKLIDKNYIEKKDDGLINKVNSIKEPKAVVPVANKEKPKEKKDEVKEKPTKKKDKFEEILSQMKKEKLEALTELHIKILRDFYEYRKKIKAIKTARPLEMYLNQLKKIQDAGYKVSEAIELMKQREWQTIKLEWIENEYKQKQDNQNTTGGNFTW